MKRIFCMLLDILRHRIPRERKGIFRLLPFGICNTTFLDLSRLSTPSAELVDHIGNIYRPSLRSRRLLDLDGSPALVKHHISALVDSDVLL